MSVTVKQLREFLATIDDDVLVKVQKELLEHGYVPTTTWADPNMDDMHVTDFTICELKPNNPYFDKKILFIEGE
jgi:hypothetical protein